MHTTASEDVNNCVSMPPPQPVNTQLDQAQLKSMASEWMARDSSKVAD